MSIVAPRKHRHLPHRRANINSGNQAVPKSSKKAAQTVSPRSRALSLCQRSASHHRPAMPAIVATI